MSDTLMTIFVIALVAVLMFIFPLMTMADRSDDISQLTVQTATTEFVDDIRTTGKLTMDKYSKYVETISATGNSFVIDLEVQTLDENPGKKTTQATATKIGENVYYSMYTSQIMEKISNGEMLPLKEGDRILARARSNNTTVSQQFNNLLFKVTGNDAYILAAEHAGIVTANGTGK